MVHATDYSKSIMRDKIMLVLTNGKCTKNVMILNFPCDSTGFKHQICAKLLIHMFFLYTVKSHTDTQQYSAHTSNVINKVWPKEGSTCARIHERISE